MEIQARISRQRVRHIIDSYRLEGDDIPAFNTYLASLLDESPSPLIELALVEAIVNGWSIIPLPRGVALLTQVHERLKQWQQQPIKSPIKSLVTPTVFEQITGLDSAVVFDPQVLTQPRSPQGASESP
ncbi:MAG: hypothetical protein AAGC54_06095 [Cyanobacteria bacterium P01_F01_bin.4]